MLAVNKLTIAIINPTVIAIKNLFLYFLIFLLKKENIKPKIPIQINKL